VPAYSIVSLSFIHRIPAYGIIPAPEIGTGTLPITRMSQSFTRSLPVGADVQPGDATHFRVWAPQAPDVAVAIERAGTAPREVALTAEGGGYFSARVEQVTAGDRYRYRLGDARVADPASRYQPDGPFGPSQVISPAAYHWGDSGWPGVALEGQVVYEMHIGTFTVEGTWRAAIERLPDVARIGITVLEIMPVSEFAGQFGWGYDGVFPFAPTRLYGEPDDFRAFVDAAHGLGLAVVLDVVYNHLGPAGCVFAQYSASYFSDKYKNEWGEALNFDGEDAAPVREYFAANAAHWIAEYHLDGLRLDATQSIHDASPDHVLALIARTARAAAPARQLLLIAENEPQDVRLVRAPATGGYGIDALWNDDFHHTAIVAMTGRCEAYYSDHRGSPQELVSAAKYGYLFQGQRYAWQKQGRGTRTRGVAPAAFVNFIENHDQLANSGDGSRIRARTSPGRYRAMTALFLLMPGTPMLFQGQEFGASAPFLYFADHAPELAEAVARGRAEFVSQFPSLASPAMQAQLCPPHARSTFERCKLDWREYASHDSHRRLHADLLALRSRDAAFRAQRAGAVDGAVLGAELFVLRFLASDEVDERLLVINLGADVVAGGFAEPLLAAPGQHVWNTSWSSEHPAYGGGGTPPVVSRDGWRIPGHSATVLRPERIDGGNRAD
jgi:maltooligosyltrehalose trehalohydrolase